MNTPKYSFHKNERLCNKNNIDRLTRNSENLRVSEYPFLLIYNYFELSSPAQVLIAVSRKNFRKAVSRNKIKRTIRNLYRHQKQKIYHELSNANKQLALMIVYVGKEILPYAVMEKSFNLLIEKLCKNIVQAN